MEGDPQLLQEVHRLRQENEQLRLYAPKVEVTHKMTLSRALAVGFAFTLGAVLAQLLLLAAAAVTAAWLISAAT